MKLRYLLSFLLLFCIETVNAQDVKDGDIVFQTSSGDLSKAIQIATHSVYSHCGIVFIEKGQPYVYEAVQPVCKTRLADWISRGKNENVVVKRLSENKLLTADKIAAMKQTATGFIGKDYDIYFGWSDDRIYCSELVWKIYKEALNLEVGQVQQLKDFDLSSALVKQKLKEHYGNDIPYNEKVIAPQAIFDSKLLMTVESNYSKKKSAN